jgi:hypothetical protein
MIITTPHKVLEVFKKAFGLGDGITELNMHINNKSVTLSVTYFVSNEQACGLKNLEEFELIPKKRICKQQNTEQNDAC